MNTVTFPGRKSSWTDEQYRKWFLSETVKYNARVKASLGLCWLWKGRMNHEPSKVRHKGRQLQPHQVSWLMDHDELPTAPLQLNHKCNMHNCVRPSHLYAGTPADNGRDLSLSGNWKGNLYQQGKGPNKHLGAKRSMETRRRIADGVRRAAAARRAKDEA